MTDPAAADPALENTPFDRRLRRLRRDRAARSGAEANPLLRRIADDLLDRLDLVTRRFEHALDLGTGPGLLAAALRAQGMQVTACDAGAVFSRAGGEQCDEDRLPFEPGSFDLVVSAGTLDSVNDLPGALIQIRRLLRPDGLFLGAFAGAGSLPVLRGALAAADEAEQRPASPRLHPQIDLRAAGDLLARAGLRIAGGGGCRGRITCSYPGLPQLGGDLRALGWTNCSAPARAARSGEVGYAAAQAAFAVRRRAGRQGDRSAPRSFT
jgi:SAM-dependent methyltransferase